MGDSPSLTTPTFGVVGVCGRTDRLLTWVRRGRLRKDRWNCLVAKAPSEGPAKSVDGRGNSSLLLAGVGKAERGWNPEARVAMMDIGLALVENTKNI